MVTSARVIWNGDPGTFYTNDTERTKYQLTCSLVNTCGFCLQYHLAVGYVWSLGLHFGCNCQQHAIKPGAKAPEPFVDFRDLLDEMPHSEQVAAIGAWNYKLLKDGVVDWKDIVTPSRVRPLREVVAIKNLDVKTLVGAGVNPRIAAVAHAAVNTPEHILVEQHRAELLANLHAAGVSQKIVVEQLSKGLASRVSIGAGPDTYGTGPAWAGGPVVPPGWGGAGHATELTRLLAAQGAAAASVGLLTGQHHPSQFELPVRNPIRRTPRQAEKIVESFCQANIIQNSSSWARGRRPGRAKQA